MIIDFHCHVGGHSDPERVIEEQQNAGVDYTVIFPLNSPDPYYEEYNKLVIKLSQKPSIIGFMRFDPSINVKKFVDEHAAKFKGIKIHPRNDNANLDEFREVLTAAEAHKMPVLFHSTPELMTLYEPAFRDFNKVSIIAAHATAYGPYKEFYNKYKNLYYGTSIKMSPMSMKRLAAINPNRIIFGSDFPYSTPTIEKARIKLCPPDYLTDHQKNLILGMNAKRLLRL